MSKKKNEVEQNVMKKEKDVIVTTVDEETDDIIETPSTGIHFEKVSYETFKNDCQKYIKSNMNPVDFEDYISTAYHNIILPRRQTRNSSGYDFYLPYAIVVNPRDSIVIPTGIKAIMPSNYTLCIHMRSSLGMKYNVRSSTTVGIIDSDYANNPDNEGDIMVGLYLAGITNKEKPLTLYAGDRFCQGIFTRYYTTDDDCPVKEERTGGIGSTGKK